MPINWNQIITTFIATVGGGGVLLAVVAWLSKTLISNRLALDAEKFRIQIKADADIQIERVKSILIRRVNIHERQVEALMTLYSDFQKADGYFRRAAAGVKFAGEPSEEEYHQRVQVALAAAGDTLIQRRLLFPPELAQQCDQLFNKIFEGRMHIELAKDPMAGGSRAEFWKKSGQIAYQEVPKILKQIEEASRKIIHSEE